MICSVTSARSCPQLAATTGAYSPAVRVVKKYVPSEIDFVDWFPSLFNTEYVSACPDVSENISSSGILSIPPCVTV